MQYARAYLIVRVSNGDGGVPYPLVFNSTLPDPIPPNSTVTNASRVDLNEELRTALPDPLGDAYYFFPLGAGQTTALFTATFVPSNQTLSVFQAQETGPGSYTVGAETTIAAAYSSGQQLPLSSAYPANTAGGATTSGFLVRVRGINSGAPLNQPFTLRIGAQQVSLVDTGIENDESISRWFPTSQAMLHTANWVTARIGAKDQNGRWVKNHPVALNVKRFVGDPSAQQIVAGLKTNAEGKAAPNPVLPTSGPAGYALKTTYSAACSVPVETNNNYGPPGSPTDHYKGTAQKGEVAVGLTGASPASQITIPFLRMCTETYLGRY